MGLIFPILGALLSAGGVFIAIGVMKGKLNQTVEENTAQARQIETLAAKSELAQAMSRFDEMFRIIQKRAEEDRASGEGRYKELYGITSVHGERISKLEISQEQIFKMLDKLEIAVSGGFRDLRQDMKELREALKQK
jgi:hypothetical protein